MEKNFKSIVKTSSKNQEDEETLGNRRVKNSQNIMIRDIEKKLGNWNIPRMDKWEVYQKGSFDFDYIAGTTNSLPDFLTRKTLNVNFSSRTSVGMNHSKNLKFCLFLMILLYHKCLISFLSSKV